MPQTSEASDLSTNAPSVASNDPDRINGYLPKWWKEAVVYQIYPRSFQDSNGDGIGDLPGITSRLDYIADLGVDVIWLCPHYQSPNCDNGYDISDYRKVMAEFGTMQDFDDLLAGIHARGMRLIVDLVVNHTSSEHRWFQESRKSKDNPYRDYYFWRPGCEGPGGVQLPPNNYESLFSGSAWKRDPETCEYYLHLFAESQPDLNWDNPKVREEVYSLMRFWLDKGCDGFRMDVIAFISKNDRFPDLLPNENAVRVYSNGPCLHDYLQEMNREVLSHYDCMTVGEANGTTIEQTPELTDERRGELNMIFNFDAVRIYKRGDDVVPWHLTTLKRIYTRQDEAIGKHSWNTVFLANHDSPRMVSIYGSDDPAWRVASAKVLNTMLLTLKGTAFLYQGDEIGMTNYPFKGISDYEDIEALNGWKHKVETGHEPAQRYLDTLGKMSRDNARTPMQWDDSANAGFCPAGVRPWFHVNPNYMDINVAEALGDPGSIYHYMQAMLSLRRSSLAFVYGDYKDLAPADEHLYLFTRVLDDDRYLVALNFSKEALPFTPPLEFAHGKVLLSSDAMSPESAQPEGFTLGPWEARVYVP